ncbi:MAG: SufD family Fe-S cluster assembly protein [Candidatus Mcinerneyibacterium aminivorans]|uniref:SufD family Fe-S cluster assembly protein n=1 Tax=Candidatus Mcinerneyibacterium aminivorans TaxID=2703815 RepID=A0A5D0MFY1_9BACT|nr:MAG: SufD family Fe-S cluster assembly protein [Candidatus Mcinerneyibacterium aminivorans]
MSEERVNLSKEDKEKMLNVGIKTKNKKNTGSYILVDDDIVEVDLNLEGVELMPIKMAIEKYDWVEEYMWKLVDPEKDKYTKMAYEDDEPKGYFIRVKKGHKVTFPLQACFYIKATRKEQVVHNILIAEEDSELHIINGCASGNYVKEGYHIGITETFLKKGSFLSYTMIHDWAPGVIVRPRSAIEVGENAHYMSNYVSLKEVKSTETSPVVYINGKDGKARLNSILFAPEKTDLFVGGKIQLNAEGARGDIISRTVTNGGDITAPVELEATVEEVSGFMECNGLILEKEGRIYSSPSLNSNKQNVELAHEASVGKIGDEEIEYLMSRGISEEQARSLIVHGFLDLKIKGLPEFLQNQIDTAVNQSIKGM